VTTESYDETAQETEAVQPAGYFSILGNLIFSPGKAFKEVARSPLIWKPIVGLIIIGLLGGFAATKMIDMSSVLTAQVDEAVARGQMTQQQAEQAMEGMARSPMGRWLGYATIITNPIGILIMALIIAGVFKLITLMMGAENTFKGVFSATLLGMTPYYFVYYLLFTLVASLKNTSGLSASDLQSFVGTNLGAYLSKDAVSKFVLHLASWIDIIRIWEIALLAIGFAAVSRKLKTSTAAVWITSLYLLVAIAVSAIQSAVGR
jgi:hypothetical protein